MAKEKARYFAFLMYPDSIPTNWETKLAEIDQPIAISPIHDKDDKEFDSKNVPSPDEKKILDAGGHVYKKPHYHGIYIANNPVTVDGVRNKLKRALGDKAINKIQIVNGLKSMYDYLTHSSADAIKKKKHRYDKKDIKLINNFDIDRYVTMDDSQKRELANQMLMFINKYQLQNMPDVLDFVAAYGGQLGLPSMDVINDALIPKIGLVRLYLDGNYHRSKNGKRPIPELDPADVVTPEENEKDNSDGQIMPEITTKKTFDWETGQILEDDK